MTDLGPMTEKRFSTAFATTAIVTAKAAAALIGLDVKTLDALSDQQIIRSVRKGKLRAYTERDLRAYLIEGPDGECPSTNPPRPVRGAKLNNVVAFTERKGGRPDAARPSRSLRKGSRDRAGTG